jgi:hypothetical protein
MAGAEGNLAVGACHGFFIQVSVTRKALLASRKGMICFWTPSSLLCLVEGFSVYLFRLRLRLVPAGLAKTAAGNR